MKITRKEIKEGQLRRRIEKYSLMPDPSKYADPRQFKRACTLRTNIVNRAKKDLADLRDCLPEMNNVRYYCPDCHYSRFDKERITPRACEICGSINNRKAPDND